MATKRVELLREKLANVEGKPEGFVLKGQGHRVIRNKASSINRGQSADPVAKKLEGPKGRIFGRVNVSGSSVIPDVEQDEVDLFVVEYGRPVEELRLRGGEGADLKEWLSNTNYSNGQKLVEKQKYNDLPQARPEVSKRLQRIMADKSITEQERNAKLRRTMEKFEANHKKGAKVKTSAKESQSIFESGMRNQGVSVEKERPILFRSNKGSK